MASQTAGIQQLLVAEKGAAAKIDEARKRKGRRLKQAKEEAQQEVEKYRQEREQQFKAYEQKYVGSREDAVTRIDQQTQVNLKQMHVDVANNKEKIISQLLGIVCDIEPAIHKNLRPDM